MKHTKIPLNNYNSITYNDIYYEGNINVPFSWEYKPGLSKVTNQNYDTNHATKLVLQPPPFSSSKSDYHRFRDEEKDIPVDLCAVQSTLLRISSFKLESKYQKEEDPFVEAYKNCTKSPFIVQGQNRDQKNNGFNWPSLRKYVHILSCKYTNDVISHKGVYAKKDVRFRFHAVNA
ncbi:hypothetical protein TSUD_05870 [Trifolium subterraneum]|uniref:Uncharacterized protein n=1 Tax=Trifolium subterraneum TaxID=3900 RepID=A0A2Z6NC44_TRISU|nr:hypothetical protein TSUD_05870 [Trifolium subterraneum]